MPTWETRNWQEFREAYTEAEWKRLYYCKWPPEDPADEDGPPRKIKQVSTREDRTLVFVDVRNPVLIGSWDELGEGTTIPGPLNPGWGYSKRWKDSRDWDDDEEEEDAWEGSMSERKYNRIARETIEELAQEKQSSLPVVLAQMVNEFYRTLDDALDVHAFTQAFNDTLLAAIKPLLTEHLAHLLNPPMIYKFANAGGETTTNGKAYADGDVKWDMATKDYYSVTATPDKVEEDDELSALTKEWARIKSGRR